MKDIFGNELEIGDYVCVPISYECSHIGQIVKLCDKTIKVELNNFNIPSTYFRGYNGEYRKHIVYRNPSMCAKYIKN